MEIELKHSSTDFNIIINNGFNLSISSLFPNDINSLMKLEALTFNFILKLENILLKYEINLSKFFYKLTNKNPVASVIIFIKYSIITTLLLSLGS